MLSDVHRLRRSLKKLNKGKERHKLEQLGRELEKSIAIAEERKQNIPIISYPGDLPIAQKKSLI